MADDEEGLTTEEIVRLADLLPPFAREELAARLVKADPKGHTLGQILPNPEDVLGPELAQLFRRMTEQRLPGRQGAVVDEMVRLHDQKVARDLLEELHSSSGDAHSRLVDGGSFIHDVPADTPTVWGRGTSVVWAEGESFMLSGPPGVGKTTLAGQIVRGRLIGEEVLGLPVHPSDARVLYLAMDRPKQIGRALQRMLGDIDRDHLQERLAVWEGPPLRDVARHPEALLELVQRAGADTVVVDSLKDAAIGLTEDEVGAGYNRARQHCLAYGVEVMELHHTVKRGANGAAPNKLEDVYGSMHLTSGAGSVVSLHGQAGDPVVQWRHLKQPVEEVGPFQVSHDHAAGTSSIWDVADVVELARRNGAEGVTAKGVAVVMFETSRPSPAQIQKARRKLNAQVRAGRLQKVDGNAGTQESTVWVATPAEFTEELDDVL